MKIILENVNPKHYDWLKKMAETLKFKVRELDISEEEEDQALERAIEAGRNDEVLSPEETSRFIDSLGQ
jgi:disulfide oxidoreductase YuzD